MSWARQAMGLLKYIGTILLLMFLLLFFDACTPTFQKDSSLNSHSYLTEGKDYIITSMSSVSPTDSTIIDHFIISKASAKNPITPNPFYYPCDCGEMIFDVIPNDDIRIVIPSNKTFTGKVYAIQQIKLKGQIYVAFWDTIQSDKTQFYIIRGDKVVGKGLSPSGENQNLIAYPPLDSTSRLYYCPPTSVKFNLFQKDTISIIAYDMASKFVDQIFRGELEAGEHEFMVVTPKMKSGVYFIKVAAHEELLQKKIIIVSKKRAENK
jgi:hypothetical protein